MLKFLHLQYFTSKIREEIFTHIEKCANDRLTSIDSAMLVNESGIPVAPPFTYLPQYISQNQKCIMETFALQRMAEVEARPLNVAELPRNVALKSSLTKQSDLESDWARHWLKELHIGFRYHRKNWENAYVLQALFEHGMFGKRGLGMACGEERIPSFLISRGCEIVAGDKPLDSGSAADASWRNTRQYTNSKNNLFYSEFIDRETFERDFELKYVDMNKLPTDMDGQFDFCWSICAIEHLGSLENGRKFLADSLRFLKPGGISVHTTEFNLYSPNLTIDNHPALSLYTRPFLEETKEIIDRSGLGEVVEFDFDPGDLMFDKYIYPPPYPHDNYPGLDYKFNFPFCPHLKILLSGFPATCIGIIIVKK